MNIQEQFHDDIHYEKIVAESLTNERRAKLKMDYQKELERLEKESAYWKIPKKSAQYKVKALGELEDAEPYIQKRSDGTEESREQAKIQVSVNGESPVSWTFSKGGQASTFGQLVNLGAQKGKLEGVEFVVVVKSDGSKNDYTIIL